MSLGPWKITNGIRYREQASTLKLHGSWDDTIADVSFSPIYMSDSDPTKRNIPTDNHGR
jgi:hypothetical protein